MTEAATAAESFYPNLFSPIRVGAHALRNRIIMGSMHTRMEFMSDPLARQVAFYAARAKGGVALIISGGHSPNEAGLMEPGAPILTSRDEIPTHRAIVNAVHEHGAKMLLQIIHAGRSSKHPGNVGPSEIKSPTGVVLVATTDRRFLLLPALVTGFLFHHAVQGWCPPVPILRRMGFRTAQEIEKERHALKIARGDYKGLQRMKLTRRSRTNGKRRLAIRIWTRFNESMAEAICLGLICRGRMLARVRTPALLYLE